MASPNPTSREGRRTALVLGGGLAGALAAYELAPYVDSVTVVDRGHRHGPGAGPAPDEPALMLHAAGARALERLHPGILDELVAAGAHRLGMTTDMAVLTLRGWLAHGCEGGFVITCSRDLARRVVRGRTLGQDNITVLENTEAVSLTGDAYVLTGAVVRDRATGRMRRLDAQIVVDATGRGKGVTRRISELGLPPVPVDSLDGGIAYATRTFRLAPHIAAGRPAVHIQPDPSNDSRGGTLLPVEGDRWIATLVGMRGTEPPLDEAGFMKYAARLRDPALVELLAGAEPLGPVHGRQSLVNRRVHLKWLPRVPKGLVLLGEAETCFNPVYGYGASTTAMATLALRRGLARYGTGDKLTPRVRRDIAKATMGAWGTSSPGERRHPGTVATMRPGRAALAVMRVLGRYSDRVLRAGTSRPAATRALVDIITLSRTPAALLAPSVVLAALRGPDEGAQGTTPPPAAAGRAVSPPHPRGLDRGGLQGRMPEAPVVPDAEGRARQVH